MTRFVLVLIGLAALTASSAGADDANAATRFGGSVRVPSNVGFSTNVSPDGQAATLLFDNVYVELNPAIASTSRTTNQTEIQTKLITFHVPYSTDKSSVNMTLDIRGFLDTDAAVARLIVCVGDRTKVVDLSTDEPEPVKLKGKLKDALAAKNAGDFQDRVTFSVQKQAAKPICQITLFLLAEHDTDVADSGSALLAVDSLDLHIAKPGKAKYTR